MPIKRDSSVAQKSAKRGVGNGEDATTQRDNDANLNVVCCDCFTSYHSKVMGVNMVWW